MSHEQYLISAVLRSTSCATVLGYELQPEMFRVYPDEWQWLLDFLNKHRSIPGERTFKVAFPDFEVEAVDDADHHAEEVRKSFAGRKLGESISGLTAKIQAGRLDEALQEMQKSILDTARQLGTVPDGDVLRDHADVMADLEEFHDRIVDTGYAGIPTGFKSWDEVTGGCKPGEFVVVGGRLGEGKSWVMTKMVGAALMEGYTVLYDSLEMTRTQVTLRTQNMLSQATGRPYDAAGLLTGTVVPDLKGYREIVTHLDGAVPGKLHIADTTRGAIGLMTLAAQIERIQPDIVFIDYLTLLTMQGDGDWRSVTSLSNGVKQLAQRYKIPIVAAAQLNRANGLTKGVPENEALARSDSIGQDADQVMNIKKRSTRVLQHKLTKNRSGVGGIKWFSEYRPGAGVIEEINSELAFELMDQDEAEADDE